MPEGPFRTVVGEEYQVARSTANKINTQLHSEAGSALKGLDIHEIQPAKFGGSPVDLANKIALPREWHAQYSTWWLRLQRSIER